MAIASLSSKRIALAFSAGAIAIALFSIFPSSAQAVTAAEKQAEADAVFAQIDTLQTSLNETQAQYDQALAERDEAIEKRDEAQQRYDDATKRMEKLQDELSQYAVANYKRDQTSYLDVLLQTTSFEDFMTSFDTIKSINDRGLVLMNESKETRIAAEEARNEYESESEIAEARMEEAEAAKIQIENTQEALREEAQKLTEEAAELAIQEELAAEEARRAEEAARQREEALALAAQGSVTTSANAGYSPGESVVMGSGYFTNPCPGATYSSGFGYRDFDSSFHMGLDMAAAEGTPYYAADSGTVMFATNDGGYNGGAGNWVVISHGNGIVTKYMHSSATYVSPGDQVERGQNIGAVGNTGNSFGAHLHFQVEVDGVAVNPLNYI